MAKRTPPIVAAYQATALQLKRVRVEAEEVFGIVGDQARDPEVYERLLETIADLEQVCAEEASKHAEL